MWKNTKMHCRTFFFYTNLCSVNMLTAECLWLNEIKSFHYIQQLILSFYIKKIIKDLRAFMFVNVSENLLKDILTGTQKNKKINLHKEINTYETTN